MSTNQSNNKNTLFVIVISVLILVCGSILAFVSNKPHGDAATPVALETTPMPEPNDAADKPEPSEQAIGLSVETTKPDDDDGKKTTKREDKTEHDSSVDATKRVTTDSPRETTKLQRQEETKPAETPSTSPPSQQKSTSDNSEPKKDAGILSVADEESADPKSNAPKIDDPQTQPPSSVQDGY